MARLVSPCRSPGSLGVLAACSASDALDQLLTPSGASCCTGDATLSSNVDNIIKMLQALAGATNGPFVAVFLTGAIGSVLANIINNQVRKTQEPSAKRAPTGQQRAA
jgi:hypothetical protein